MHLSEKVTKFQSNKYMSQDITNLRNENPENQRKVNGFTNGKQTYHPRAKVLYLCYYRNGIGKSIM